MMTDKEFEAFFANIRRQIQENEHLFPTHHGYVLCFGNTITALDEDGETQFMTSSTSGAGGKCLTISRMILNLLRDQPTLSQGMAALCQAEEAGIASDISVEKLGKPN